MVSRWRKFETIMNASPASLLSLCSTCSLDVLAAQSIPPYPDNHPHDTFPAAALALTRGMAYSNTKGKGEGKGKSLTSGPCRCATSAHASALDVMFLLAKRELQKA